MKPYKVFFTYPRAVLIFLLGVCFFIAGLFLPELWAMGFGGVAGILMGVGLIMAFFRKKEGEAF
jgi:membrane-bound ClpP family serine protease